ncbi:hypothetical protein WJX75_004919 [Coccomyxa subellipsoidea]|uniref:Thioredoxin domain-containing protein n=1 Tax=Coccomyxa subellipsoidea TaxID=248742 RepID=A0ABR2YW64_9CHLO
MEAAAMDSAVPSSDVPTNQPAGTSGMRCLAVRSPQPMQARRQWGVLSLQQQAARPPEPQENSAQQPQPQQRASRGPLAEHIQNDSDFLEVPKLRGFQGAAAKRRSHWPAPLRNGRADNAVPPTSTRSVEVEVEVAEPLEVSPEAIREGGASHGSREPAAGQPQWRRKQGHSMEPAGRGDKQSNLMSTGLQLALNKAADPADVQDAGPAADAEMRAGPPCISVLRFGMSKELRSQSIAHLSTPQHTTCLMALGTERLFAAGEGGSVQQWRCCEAQCSFEELPALPAAKYGDIEFPNIAQLAPAGPDFVLACSSTGSVALWNHARGELLIARQHSAYNLRDLHLLPLPPSVAERASGCELRAALAAVRDSRPPAERRGPWRLAHVLMQRSQLFVRPMLTDQEVSHVAMCGTLAAVALPGGTIHIIDAVQITRSLLDVTEDTFEKEVLKADVPVLVDFWATWCGPCKLITPLLNTLEKEFGDSLKIVKIEADPCPNLMEQYKVYGLPTLMLFKDGAVIEGSLQEGAIDRKKLIAYLEKFGLAAATK